MTRKALALGALMALLACGSARASDSYRITAGGNQDWGPQTGGFDQTGTTQLERTGTMIDNRVPVAGSVDYAIQAGPGIVRASLDGHVSVSTGEAYPFNPSLQAVAATELTVGGPTPEVNVSLNLHVDGVLKSTVCKGGPPCGALSVTIQGATGVTARAVSEFNARGEPRGNGLGLAIDPVAGGYRVHGDVTTAQFGLTTGIPHAIGFVLDLSGRFGGNPGGEQFGGGFGDPRQRWQVSYAPAGPVLNLPAGYTVSGNGVVNNRWDDPFSDDLVVSNCQDPALAQVTTVAGSLVLRCDGAAFPNLTHVIGDVVLDGIHSPHLAFPGPVLVDGSVRVVGSDGDADLDLGDDSVGEAIDVSSTGGDLTIDVGSVGGAIDVSGTGGDLTIDTGTVGGAIDVSGTGGDLTIDPGTVGGDLDLSDNPDAGVVDVGDGQIGGDLTITDDGTAVVNANDSLTVSGDADVETDGGGMLDLSGVAADGDETVVADGADGVSATTAGGATDVAILGGTAAMHAVLPDGTFDRPVAFTVTRRGDDPAEGAVDPIAGYTFAFAVPTLNADAALSFTVDLTALDAATRAALLGPSATIATKPDAPGSAYTAFPRCAGALTPGCVTVTLLAADGGLAPAGTEPALARFDGFAGHFSTWAVALVHPQPATPPANPPAASAPSRPTRAQIRELLRSHITPRGRAGRIGALLEHGYRLRFRAPTAGTAKVGWYRKHVLIARGRHRFATAGRATIVMKLTRAGRRQLRHAKRARLTARASFAGVTAARSFTLRR